MKAGSTEYQVHNYMEDIVKEILQKLIKKETDICTCTHCLADMTASALNTVTPKYETSGPDMSQLDEDALYEVMSKVYAAMVRVSKNPRHDQNTFDPEAVHLYNLSEVLVNNVLSETLASDTSGPTDSEYLAKIASICLNEVKPRYALTRKGVSFQRLAQLEHQHLPDLLVIIHNAIKAVSK